MICSFGFHSESGRTLGKTARLGPSLYTHHQLFFQLAHHCFPALLRDPLSRDVSLHAQFASLVLCPLAILAFFLPNIEACCPPPPPSLSPAVSGLMFPKSLPAVNST